MQRRRPCACQVSFPFPCASRILAAAVPSAASLPGLGPSFSCALHLSQFFIYISIYIYIWQEAPRRQHTIIAVCVWGVCVCVCACVSPSSSPPLPFLFGSFLATVDQFACYRTCSQLFVGCGRARMCVACADLPLSSFVIASLSTEIHRGGERPGGWGRKRPTRVSWGRGHSRGGHSDRKRAGKHTNPQAPWACSLHAMRSYPGMRLRVCVRARWSARV